MRIFAGQGCRQECSTNRLGLTALDVFRKARREIQDFEACHIGLRRANLTLRDRYDEAKYRIANELEVVLEPREGPTRLYWREMMTRMLAKRRRMKIRTVMMMMIMIMMMTGDGDRDDDEREAF